MEIKLNKKIKCDVRSSIMEAMFVDETRTDILAFLTFVKEKGVVDERSVNLEFLMQEYEKHPYGKRYITLMKDLGLIEDATNEGLKKYNFASPLFAKLDQNKDVIKSHGTLTITEQASKMVDDREVMFPKRGEYRIYLSDNPIFDADIIGIEEVESKQYSEEQKAMAKNRANGVHNEQKSTSYENLEKINEFIGKILYLPLGENKKVIINSVESKFEKLPEEVFDLTLSMRRDSSNDDSSAMMRKGNTNKEFTTGSMPDYNHILSLISEKSNMTFDEKYGRIMVPGNRLNEIKDGFFINLPAVDIDIPKYGIYHVQSISNMPCMPDDIEAAKEWVKRFIEKDVRERYTTPERFEEIVSEGLKSVAEWYNPEKVRKGLSTFYQLLIDIKANSNIRDELYWHIVAIDDLSLTEYMRS